MYLFVDWWDGQKKYYHLCDLSSLELKKIDRAFAEFQESKITTNYYFDKSSKMPDRIKRQIIRENWKNGNLLEDMARANYGIEIYYQNTEQFLKEKNNCFERLYGHFRDDMSPDNDSSIIIRGRPLKHNPLNPPHSAGPILFNNSPLGTILNEAFDRMKNRGRDNREDDEEEDEEDDDEYTETEEEHEITTDEETEDGEDDDEEDNEEDDDEGNDDDDSGNGEPHANNDDDVDSLNSDDEGDPNSKPIVVTQEEV